MSDDEKPKRAPRQTKATDTGEAKPARGRKAKSEINLDDAFKQTRDAAFLAGGAGGKDLTRKIAPNRCGLRAGLPPG